VRKREREGERERRRRRREGRGIEDRCFFNIGCNTLNFALI
jgi:hypothetical protein